MLVGSQAEELHQPRLNEPILRQSEKVQSRVSNIGLSQSKVSETTYQSMDRSMQLRVTDERLAKLEKMYEELS